MAVGKSKSKKKSALKKKSAVNKKTSKARKIRKVRKAKKPEEKVYERPPVRTEAEQVAALPEDLYDAWLRLREVLEGMGEHTRHNSHWAMMFNRRRCYAFVRPKKKYLELNFFLAREVKSPLLKRATRDSKTRVGHVMYVIHRDQIEAPLTEWLEEAFTGSV